MVMIRASEVIVGQVVGGPPILGIIDRRVGSNS